MWQMVMVLDMLEIIMNICIEGKESLLRQNMPFGDIDYLMPVIFKKEKTQKESLPLLLTCLKISR